MFLFSLVLNLLFIIVGLFLIQKLGGLKHVIYKATHRGLAEVYEHRKNIFELLPERDSAIVFLGNSITAQCEWAELFDNSRIINRGIPGDATDGILVRLPHILKHNPKKIFLMIGVNDLFYHEIPYIIENYKKIVEEIITKSPNTQLYIQSVLPINNKVKHSIIDNETIRNLNEQIKEISDYNHLIYIDLYSKLIDDKEDLNADFTKDGIHLNGNGYMIWKNEIEKYVQG